MDLYATEFNRMLNRSYKRNVDLTKQKLKGCYLYSKRAYILKAFILNFYEKRFSKADKYTLP